MVWIDPEDNQMDLVEINRHLYMVGKTQGEKITIAGFSGSAKTESGREGDFYISFYKTQSIEFE